MYIIRKIKTLILYLCNTIRIMIPTYNNCKHYCEGYCTLSVNGDGINTTCCERNDCPQAVYQVRSGIQALRQCTPPARGRKKKIRE